MKGRGPEHLTDEQFTDLLSGTQTPEVLHHAQSCVACGLELERVRSSMESFNTMSLAWARRESVRIKAPAVSSRRSWMTVPTWSMASGLAAVLVVAGMMAGVHLERSHDVTGRSEAAAAAGPTEAAVVADNQLMAAIEDELGRQEAAPIAAADTGATHARARQTTSRRSTD